MTPTLPDNPEEESEATAIKALSKPDPLLEELQVVRLEGRYFCFDRHEAKNRQGASHSKRLLAQLYLLGGLVRSIYKTFGKLYIIERC
ncbi:MAG: hypothetical protein ACKO1L_02005 [Brachymonas sp.]